MQLELDASEIPPHLMEFFEPVPVPGLKPKDTCGIPWRVALALQADGWYLRQDIIYSKKNPMPESVRDRCTRSHEYLFLLSKRPDYFYDADAIREPHLDARRVQKEIERQHRRREEGNGYLKTGGELVNHSTKWGGGNEANSAGRNRRSVWTIATEPYAAAHFATFPQKLVEPCILAGCPEKICSACRAPMVNYGHEQITQQNTVQAQVRRVRSVLRGTEPEVLQPFLFDEGSGEEKAPQTEAVYPVREGVQSPGQGGAMFPEVQRDLANSEWDATKADMDGETPTELEGGDSQLPGLFQRVRPNGEEISHTASNGNGEDVGQAAHGTRICPPQERHQNGQQTGKSRTGREKPAHGHCDVPALSEDVRNSLSPCCGAPLIPGTVLDPFMGSGTVAIVAERLGRHWLGIELSAAYGELAKKRTEGITQSIFL